MLETLLLLGRSRNKERKKSVSLGQGARVVSKSITLGWRIFAVIVIFRGFFEGDCMGGDKIGLSWGGEELVIRFFFVY